MPQVKRWIPTRPFLAVPSAIQAGDIRHHRPKNSTWNERRMDFFHRLLQVRNVFDNAEHNDRVKEAELETVDGGGWGVVDLQIETFARKIRSMFRKLQSPDVPTTSLGSG